MAQQIIKKAKAKNDLPRAKSAKEMQEMVFKTWTFTGKWKKLFGDPETSGCWLIWGESFNGKTTFILELCNYLTNFGKVAFDSLEQGWCQDTQKATKDAGLDSAGSKFHFLHKEPIPLLIERLKKHKSADIVVLDSLQYTDMTFKQYVALRAMFPKKLFIIISHAEGKEPAGSVAKKIKYDAAKKIRIEGFRAFAQVRGRGSNYMDIWAEEAAKYWNELN